MGDENEHRVDVRLCRPVLHQCQDLGDLRQGQEQVFPQFFLLILGQAAAGDRPLDLLPRLEVRPLLVLAVLRAL